MFLCSQHVTVCVVDGTIDKHVFVHSARQIFEVHHPWTQLYLAVQRQRAEAQPGTSRR